jgi:hypothetical protein
MRSRQVSCGASPLNAILFSLIERFKSFALRPFLYHLLPLGLLALRLCACRFFEAQLFGSVERRKPFLHVARERAIGILRDEIAQYPPVA